MGCSFYGDACNGQRRKSSDIFTTAADERFDKFHNWCMWCCCSVYIQVNAGNIKLPVLDFVIFLFLWLSLYGLIQSYQAPIAVALSFFFFASLAAVSFALTWLIALYVGTAGTVFVAAKLISANMRIEGGGRDPRGRPRVRYE